jgi:hypothetical protein
VHRVRHVRLDAGLEREIARVREGETGRDRKRSFERVFAYGSAEPERKQVKDRTTPGDVTPEGTVVTESAQCTLTVPR